MTFLENLEPLLVASEKYAATEEAWRLMQDKEAAVPIEVWDKAAKEKGEAIQTLFKAAIEYSKWGKIVS